MIVGEESSKKNVKDEMQESPFIFHLTGSRFFDNAHRSSDTTDYFADARAEGLPLWLRMHGFREVTGKKYLDTNTVMVYTYASAAPGERIDVQLVKNVEAKLKAQEAMKKHRVYPSKEIWNTVWELLGVE